MRRGLHNYAGPAFLFDDKGDTIVILEPSSPLDSPDRYFTMNITIRPAQKSDSPIIRSLILDGISIWGKGLEPNLKPWVDVITTLDYIEKNIDSPHYRIFMAEYDGVPVGTVSVNFENTEISHMGGLYCDIKGHGLGTQLLHHTMNISSQHGYGKMECEIYEGNTPSISLMKKYGAYRTESSSVAEVTYLKYEFDLTA